MRKKTITFLFVMLLSGALQAQFFYAATPDFTAGGATAANNTGNAIAPFLLGEIKVMTWDDGANASFAWDENGNTGNMLIGRFH